MRISIAGMFGSSPRRDFGFVRAVAQTAEELGFWALSVPEHVVFFTSYESKYPYSPDGSTAWSADTGIYDPLMVVQAAAAVTERLRFVTGVLILPQRPALLTAKEVLTLDHATGGRFELGVGSGWSWEEYGALGVPFEGRGRRMDEYIEAMRCAWTEEVASYQGEFVQFNDVVLNPPPLTPGGPRIIIGGDSAPAMRRAARMGDGWYGWWAKVELGAHLERFHTIMADAGRSADADDFSLKIGLPFGPGPLEALAEAADEARRLGVDELVLAGPVPAGNAEEVLAGYAEATGLVASGD